MSSQLGRSLFGDIRPKLRNQSQILLVFSGHPDLLADYGEGLFLYNLIIISLSPLIERWKEIRGKP